MRSPQLRDEDGFTLIEIMVAGLIIVIAFTSLAVVFASGQSAASADVQESQLINIADQQIEQIRSAVTQLGFGKLAINVPAGSTANVPGATAGGQPLVPRSLSATAVRNTFFDPDHFIENGCYEIADNYDDVNVSSAAPYGSAPSGFDSWADCQGHAEPLAVFSGGFINWTSTASPCASGSGTTITVPCTIALPGTGCSLSSAQQISSIPPCAVTVYAFVTYAYVGCASSATGGAATACPTITSGVVTSPTGGSNITLPTTTTSNAYGDSRRVTVVVVPNFNDSTNFKSDARVTPVYISTLFANPTPSTSQASSLGLQLQLNL